jgi:hypothetical protein
MIELTVSGDLGFRETMNGRGRQATSPTRKSTAEKYSRHGGRERALATLCAL